MLGKVNKLKKFLVVGICALVCLTSVDVSSAFAKSDTPSWSKRWIYYRVIKHGRANTGRKKHRYAHKYSSVPYVKTRRDATCVRTGWYQYRCVYPGCRAYKWEITANGAPHRLYGEMKIVKQGNCQVDTQYKLRCRDCGQWIPEKMEGDHVYVTRRGRHICKFCGREDKTFTDGGFTSGGFTSK